MHPAKYKTIILVSLIGLLSGCLGGGGTMPIRYYLVDPVEYTNDKVKAVRPLSIEVIDLDIPQYLERFHIASRSNENQLTFSEDHQWGENLRKNLIRTLARNLSYLLSTIDIATPLNRTASSPDYRLQVYIEQFEHMNDNAVKLVARWQLLNAQQTEPLGIFGADIKSQQTIEQGNYDQMVSVMRELYGELSEEIADSIMQQEQQ